MEPLAALLDRATAAAQALKEQPVSSDSPAAALSQSGVLAGMGAPKPGHEATYLPLLVLAHPVDHLTGLSALLRAEQTIMASLSILRPVLEGLAAVHYLLEPDIGDRERIRRWANQTLDGYVETLRVLDPKDRQGDIGLHYGHKIYWLKQQATAAGFTVQEVKVPWSPQPGLHLEPKPPSDQQLVKGLLDDVGEKGTTGALMHRMTSAVLHGGTHGLSLFIGRDEAQQISPGVFHAPLRFSFASMAKWSVSAAWGLPTTCLRAGAFYGWDARAFEDEMQAVMQAWRPWLDA